MSDRFELEMKEALKESTKKSLAGWEFTPAMRQAVLKQIAEEEKVLPLPPASGRRRQVNPRPYMWVAAAAAAFVVAVNMMDIDLGGGGRVKMESAQAPQPAASTQSEAMTESAPAREAPNEKSAVTIQGGMGARSEEQGKSVGTANAEFKEEVAVTSAAQAQDRADTAMMMAPPTPPAPARIYLVVPEARAAVALKAPNPGQAQGISIAAVDAGPENLAMVRIGASNAVRTSNSLQLLDDGGAKLWEQRLPEGAGPLVAWNGQVATVAGQELFLYNADGQRVQNLSVGPAEALAISADGRVAAIVGSTLSVYDGSKLQFRVEGASPTGLAFSSDGSLAAVLREQDGLYLQLFGQDGNPLTRAKLQGNGQGIAFAGDVILVGGEAFHRSGQPLWQAPFPTQEVYSLGPDGPFLVRDAMQTISLVRPADGTELWTAEHTGVQTLRTAISSSGDLLAVVARVENGTAVWVLDQQGGLRFAERLEGSPVGVAVEGETLYLLMPEGLVTRTLDPR